MRRVYLDHNATTPVAPEVLAAMRRITQEYGKRQLDPTRSGSARAGRWRRGARVGDAMLGASPGTSCFDAVLSPQSRHFWRRRCSFRRPQARPLLRD